MNDNLVEEWQKCPNCGERNVDLLLINDSDIVECERCGTRYDLGKMAVLHITIWGRIKQFLSNR